MWSRAKRFLGETEARRDSAPPRTQPSLARDALVVSIDPASGKLWNGAHHVVPVALMVELAHEGRVAVSGTGRRTELHVRDPTPLGDPELDDALVSIHSGVFGHRVRRLVHYVPQTSELLRRLIEDGVVEQVTHRRLGIALRRYRPTSSAGRDQLVARLRDALVGESVPDQRTALLASVLLGIHHRVYVPKQDVRESYRHDDEIRRQIGAAERAIVEAAERAMTDADG